MNMQTPAQTSHILTVIVDLSAFLRHKTQNCPWSADQWKIEISALIGGTADISRTLLIILAKHTENFFLLIFLLPFFIILYGQEQTSWV